MSPKMSPEDRKAFWQAVQDADRRGDADAIRRAASALREANVASFQASQEDDLSSGDEGILRVRAMHRPTHPWWPRRATVKGDESLLRGHSAMFENWRKEGHLDMTDPGRAIINGEPAKKRDLRAR